MIFFSYFLFSPCFICVVFSIMPKEKQENKWPESFDKHERDLEDQKGNLTESVTNYKLSLYCQLLEQLGKANWPSLQVVNTPPSLFCDRKHEHTRTSCKGERAWSITPAEQREGATHMRKETIRWERERHHVRISNVRLRCLGEWIVVSITLWNFTLFSFLEKLH